jgi:2-haloacid dehalogenase
LATVWRDKQIEYTRLVTTSNHGDHYQPFWTITRSALVFAIKLIEPSARCDWPSHEACATQLMNQYRHLSAFPENREVLQALKDRNIVTGILSNGEPEMLGIAVRSAGLDGLLDHIISADPVRRYKTHPQAYAQGEKCTGLTREEIVFVSSNAWDALGATWFGYRTLWVNRQNLPFEELGTQPTRTAQNLRDVLTFFN